MQGHLKKETTVRWLQRPKGWWPLSQSGASFHVWGVGLCLCAEMAGTQSQETWLSANRCLTQLRHGSDSQEDSEREAGLQKYLRAGPQGPVEEGVVAGLAGEKATGAALGSWEQRCCQLQWVCLCV